MSELKITLEAARVNAHLTQVEAAKAIGVHPATIINWESGKTKDIGISNLNRLCQVYGISLDNIFFA